MKKYILPEIEIAKFEVEDIVTLSGSITTKAITGVNSSEFTIGKFSSDWQDG